MIVITAPTGNIGHQVLNGVLSADATVRVVVRDPDRLPNDVRDRVEVVSGSHGDPETISSALAGAEALFWLVPTDYQASSVDDAYVGFTRPAAEAIRRQGVTRVVDISSLGRGTPYADRAGHVTASLAMDDLLAATGAALRSVANPSFMENLLRQAAAIKEQGMFFDVISPGLAMPTAATSDIAAVATRLLLDTTWTGREEVPVLGPEDLSHEDMAQIASDVLATPVRYQQVPMEALRSQLVGSGMSEAMAQGMVDMMTAKEHGLDLEVTRTAQHAVQTPTTFREWCRSALRPAVEAA